MDEEVMIDVRSSILSRLLSLRIPLIYITSSIAKIESLDLPF